jgi:hypothetical protein
MASFPDFDGEIDSVEALQKLLSTSGSDFHEHVKYWYRGQSDASWAAQPGLFRKGGITWNTEKHLTQDFSVLGAALLSDANRDADTYFVQQHYGMPTRLLDWTHSPLAALYFATRENYKKDGRIFFIDAYQCRARNGATRTAQIPATSASPQRSVEFNGIATSRHPVFRAAIRPIFDWDADTTAMPNFVIPVRPDHLGGRVNFQHSCFTFHSDNHKEFTNDDNRSLKTYKIPTGNKEAIFQHLSKLRVDEYSIYGDLSSLAIYLKRSYRIP